MLIQKQFNKQKYKFKKLGYDGNATDPGKNQSMLVLTILEKNQRNKIEIFLGKCKIIIKDGKLSRRES